MTLIKSISGIRGTIGGKPGRDLTPLDVVKFSSAYATWLGENQESGKLRVVVGRDARISGPMMEQIVCATLTGMGIEVLNLGPAGTPTVEIAVAGEKADGGIIITASHNPGQWNALKLLNKEGEFLSAEAGSRILELAESGEFTYAGVDSLGEIRSPGDYGKIHIKKILDLGLVDVARIKKSGFKVAVDGVNSVGGVILPELLRNLGIRDIIELHCTPSGMFPHNPEPLPEHLGDLSRAVKESGADLGLAVDPDVDRLAIMDEHGDPFGEEYTLVAAADYVLERTPGNTVSNLSSTRALRDVAGKYGGKHFSCPVGEVNVVTAMKQHNAVIGGEGSGGVIYPPLHYGRDALVGAALFLTTLALRGMTVSELKRTLPEYHMTKSKVALDESTDTGALLEKIKHAYSNHQQDVSDGVKIDLEEGWIQIRRSNTEAILRIYTEARTKKQAEQLSDEISALIPGF